MDGRISHLLRVALLFITTLTTAALPAQTRIMPLGNSITEGTGTPGITGYRKPLWNLISQYNIDFVGSQNDGDNSGFDQDHQGHPGKTTIFIRDNLQGWLEQQSPDFVLFHIGTNDISENRSTQAIISDIEASLDIIWNYRFDTRVFLCAIVPRKDGKDAQTRALNDEIWKLVLRRRDQNGNLIHFVNQYEAITADPNWQNNLMWDSLHPNEAGYQRMAEKFESVLVRFLDPATPVELVAFTAFAQRDLVTLQWRTDSETNNYGFYVEHSRDGEVFEQAGFLPGFGTTLEPQEYEFLHKVSEAGEHFYRLRQVDTDGTTAYSQVLKVTVTQPATLVLQQNYPNPFRTTEGTTIEFELEKPQNIRLYVVDILGRQVATLEQGFRQAGYHSLRWDGRNDSRRPVSSGSYFIVLENEATRRVQRLQIIR